MSLRSNRGLAVAVAALAACLAMGGCARKVRLQALPEAKGGVANVRVTLTYNRNNSVQIELQAPEPSAYGAGYTAYVAWIATPDRKHVSNAGRIRVENGKGKLVTITALRRFRLFLTVEENGETQVPGPQVVYESPKEIEW